MDSNYHIESVSPERMLDCVKAIEHGCSDFKKIGQFIYERPNVSGGAKRTLSKALKIGTGLKLFEEQDGEYFPIVHEGFDPKSWNDEEKRLFFRTRIQKFKPFLVFYDFISLGHASESAAAKTNVLLDLEPRVEGRRNPLAQWGQFVGIFEWKDGNLLQTDNIHTAISKKKISFLEDVSQSLSDKLLANSYLHKLIGDEVYDFLGESVQRDLVKALISSQREPGHALRDAGNALEDHLKKIAEKRGISLLDTHGKPIQALGAIIQDLRRKRVLADHHKSSLLGLEVFLSSNVLLGLNAFRKMPSHGKNFEANMRWSVSEEIAIIVVLQVILAIKSTYYYGIKKSLRY